MYVDNIRGDSKAIDHHAVGSKEKVAESLEDMFPILVAG